MVSERCGNGKPANTDALIFEAHEFLDRVALGNGSRSRGNIDRLDKCVPLVDLFDRCKAVIAGEQSPCVSVQHHGLEAGKFQRFDEAELDDHLRNVGIRNQGDLPFMARARETIPESFPIPPFELSELPVMFTAELLDQRQ
jgi:hypothetical protein